MVSKKFSCVTVKPSASQTIRELARKLVNALRRSRANLRAVIDRIHRRDDGEEDLGGADVARRFVAADVLLARLQREAIGGAAFGVVRNADEPAGHVTFVLVARREISRVRSAEAERNAKTLRAADGDIGAEFARRFQ